MLEYLYEEGRQRYRVRVATWPSDCFEIMSPSEFDQLKVICSKFPSLLTLTEIGDD